MVRQMSCILSINGNIQKANCDMQTAEFSTIRKIRLLFLLLSESYQTFFNTIFPIALFDSKYSCA